MEEGDKLSFLAFAFVVISNVYNQTVGIDIGTGLGITDVCSLVYPKGTLFGIS